MFVLFLNQALHDFSSFLLIVFISTETEFLKSIIMLHKISVRGVIIYTIPQKIQLVEENVKFVAYLTVLHGVSRL